MRCEEEVGVDAGEEPIRCELPLGHAGDHKGDTVGFSQTTQGPVVVKLFWAAKPVERGL